MATETFFMLLVFAACFWYLGAPLLRRDEEVFVDDPQREVDNLKSQKDEVLQSLKEIELDYQMKKISEEDYKEQYAETFEEGKTILKRIDS